MENPDASRRRLLARLCPALFALTGLAVVSAGGAPAGAKAACQEGTHRFGSVQARTFCGPATATVKIGAKTLTFKGGTCETGPLYVSLNIGTVVLGTTKKTKPDYFGMNVGKTPGGGSPAKTDGTYTADGNVLTFVKKNVSDSILRPTITLTNKRTRGTFSGTLLSSGAQVSGSFRCT